MAHREPEYRRRIREKREKDKSESEEKRNKSSQNARIEKIICSIEGIVKQIERYTDEKTPENRGKRRREHWEIAGLWAAAIVGLVAIISSMVDSSRQRDVMSGQLDEMKSQLDVLQSQQRPWICVSVIADELKFDKTTGDATFTYRINEQNSGNSVAVMTRFAGAKIIPLRRSGDVFTEFYKEQIAVCENSVFSKATEYQDTTWEGQIIFPSMSYPENGSEYFGGSIQIPNSDIMRNAVTGKNISDIYFSAALVGCVTYKDSITDIGHQTGFIYIINRVDADQGNQHVMLKFGTDLVAPNVALDRWYFSSGKIN